MNLAQLLKDWTTTATIAALVGTSPASAVIVLKRMVLERLVDMRRKTGPKGGAAVRYEWKAKDQRGLQLAMQRETHCERGLTAPTKSTPRGLTNLVLREVAVGAEIPSAP